MTLPHALRTSYSSMQLLITFPNTFDIADSSACTVKGFNNLMSSSYTCVSSSSAKSILIGSFMSGNLSASTLTSFNVTGVRNPYIR